MWDVSYGGEVYDFGNLADLSIYGGQSTPKWIAEGASCIVTWSLIKPQVLYAKTSPVY